MDGKEGERTPDNHTNKRVQDVPCLRDVFKRQLVTKDAKKTWVADTPLIRELCRSG
jgi:hypothetical protein